MRKLATLVSVLLLAALGASACQAQPPANAGAATNVAERTTSTLATGNQIGNLAPDFTLKDLRGQEVRLSSFRGQPVLLNFWATWCGPCVEELPEIQQVADDHEAVAPDLVVLAVDLQEASGKVGQFVTEHRYTFPVLLDVARLAGNAYKISAIPTTYFLDAAGVIRDVQVGSFRSRSEIDAKIKQAVGGASSLPGAPPATSATASITYLPSSITKEEARAIAATLLPPAAAAAAHASVFAMYAASGMAGAKPGEPVFRVVLTGVSVSREELAWAQSTLTMTWAGGITREFPTSDLVGEGPYTYFEIWVNGASRAVIGQTGYTRPPASTQPSPSP